MCMVFTRKVNLIFLLSMGVIQGFSQSKMDYLGNPSAIVLAMEIDEGRKYIMSANATEIQIWNYESKSLVRSWPSPAIPAIDFNDNLLAGVSRLGELFIWDIDTGDQRLYTISSTPLSCLTWIDSLWIVAASDDGMLYKINSETGEINASAKSDQSISALSVGLTNSFLAGNSVGELELYDATSLKLKKSIKAHKSWIREIHSIESGKYFLTASDDRALKKWNTPDLSELKTLHSEGWITSVDYFVDETNGGVIRATGTGSGKISVSTNFANYHANTHAIVNRIVLLKNIIPVIQVIVATHGGGIQIWSGSKMKIKSKF